MDAVGIAVPEPLVDAHVELLNAFEAILTDIEAMQVAFSDPLYALARIRNYENDGRALFTAFQNIALVLKANGAIYANDEDGAFFYLFAP